jgi:hypothetical protein
LAKSRCAPGGGTCFSHAPPIISTLSRSLTQPALSRQSMCPLHVIVLCHLLQPAHLYHPVHVHLQGF